MIVLAIAFLVGLSVLERVRNPGPTDWALNLQCWVIDFGTAYLVLKYWPEWQGGSLLDAAAMPAWLAIPIFFLVRDFTEWGFHYAQHRIPALWALHSLHHSDYQMTALTTNRHFWADRLIKSLTVWPFATMLIAPTENLLNIYGLILLYNYFVHANLKVNFGRFSWLLNSPAYHRRHHSRLPEHYDTNFAALFPIFDVIFGTYRRPDGWPPCGLDDAPRSIRDLLVWPWRRAGASRTMPETRPAVGEVTAEA